MHVYMHECMRVSMCNTCSGEGIVQVHGDSTQSHSECPACRGQGYLKGSDATTCVMQIRLYTLLPIVTSHGGTRPVAYTMFSDAMRIKTALPNEQKVVMRTIHEGVQAIASAVILERMPVRFAGTRIIRRIAW